MELRKYIRIPGSGIMNRHIFAMIGLLFTVSAAVATTPPADSNDLVTLDDYLRYASLNNAELHAEFESWQAALEEIPQAKALPDPTLSYGYLARQSDMQMGQTVSIMQEFPWFGKLDAKTKAAIKSASAAKQSYEATKLVIANEIKENFYEYLFLAGALEIAKQNLELLGHFEQVARTKYETAEALHPDIIRAQVELTKVENVLRSLEPLQTPIVAKLNALMNRPIDANLPWPEKQPLRQIGIDREMIHKMVKENNPQLSQLDFEVEAARKKIVEAQKRFYPNIGIGAEWAQFDKSGGNSGRDAVTLMFQINLPLWRDSYRAGERQAQAMARKFASLRIDKENTLLSRTEQVIYELGDSDRKIRLYRDALVPKAEELLTASETAYQAATIDFLSLIDAQRMLLEYSLSYEEAVRDYRQKLAELESLTGIDLQ